MLMDKLSKVGARVSSLKTGLFSMSATEVGGLRVPVASNEGI